MYTWLVYSMLQDYIVSHDDWQTPRFQIVYHKLWCYWVEQTNGLILKIIHDFIKGE
jgi:hypothetical protein